MRPDLPSGTVTFLFTDVEGSTRLLHELGAAEYAQALAEHRSIVRSACAAHGGAEVDTQGDAFFVAFPTAPGALEAARAIAQGLEPTRIHLRMGLHTGTPLLTDEGYVGEDVHRAARIAAAGHGGQVLVSQSTAALLDGDLHDLGMHRLKDLTAPQRLYQLGSVDRPPLRSLHLTNLPIPSTPFVGRERELEELASAMVQPGLRLLTLTGPGGTGKTRLAAQAVGRAADAFPDGAWWVPLASIHDAALVLPAAGSALGATDEDVARQIGDRRLLLLFDNFEHVTEASGSLADLLSACPNLLLVVTSRESLHLTSEQEYPVPPFAHDDARSFFASRARATSPTFMPDATVDEICRRLDELPLALELAAARVKVLSAPQILERLDQALPLLTGGARDRPERQRTLHATIAWSYGLLSLDEQRLFAQLSVFVGGCTLEAVDAVAEADLDTLQSLVDKSLVRFTHERYWMLETIREYADSLDEWSDVRAAADDAHLTYFLDLAIDIEPRLTGRDQQLWLERLATEFENVRAALEHACMTGDRERALMLAGTVWRHWWTRGPIDDAARWYDRIDAIDGDASDLARARALFGAAHVAEARGDVESTRALFEEAAVLLRELGETRWLVLALTHLAGTFDATDPGHAEALQLEGIALAEASGDRRGAAVCRLNLALPLAGSGQTERARALLREALDNLRELGSTAGVAAALQNLATLDVVAGDLDAAAGRIATSYRLSRTLGDKIGQSLSLCVAAAIAIGQGELESAARVLGANSSLARDGGFSSDARELWLLGDLVAQAQELLGPSFRQRWDEGAELDADAAFALVIPDGPTSDPASAA